MSEPPAFDLEGPSSARVSDYLLGGYDNYQADRDLADALEQICPGAREIALSGREFLARAVTWAATQGITQLIDLGCGIPAAAEVRSAENLRYSRPDADTHAIARAVNPAATVAYVDHDPEVCDFLRDVTLDPAAPGIAVVTADLRDPEAVLEDKGLREVIDPDEPVCLLFASVLPDRAQALVAEYAGLIAPGSYVAISCPRFDAPAAWAQITEAYSVSRLHNFTRKQFAALFDGLDLEPPGIVPAVHLRAGWQQVPETPPAREYMLAGLGRSE